MIKFLRTLRDKSVFKKLPDGPATDKAIVLIFHRSTVTLYLIYALWGATTFAGIIPQHALEQGSFFQQVFSASYTLVALSAALGAIFFPETGRLELFAGSGFVALLTYYLIANAIQAFSVPGGDALALSRFLFGTTHLIIPIARSIYIYHTLIAAAKKAEGQ